MHASLKNSVFCRFYSEAYLLSFLSTVPDVDFFYMSIFQDFFLPYSSTFLFFWSGSSRESNALRQAIREQRRAAASTSSSHDKSDVEVEIVLPQSLQHLLPATEFQVDSVNQNTFDNICEDSDNRMVPIIDVGESGITSDFARALDDEKRRRQLDDENDLFHRLFPPLGKSVSESVQVSNETDACQVERERAFSPSRQELSAVCGDIYAEEADALEEIASHAEYLEESATFSRFDLGVSPTSECRSF